MSTTQIMTQTGLRLRIVALEMLSIVDRSVKCPSLRNIIEYCVPRRLLGSFTIWGMRGNDGMMWLTVSIDYIEHDRQITVGGTGLPDDCDFASDANSSCTTSSITKRSGVSCPQVNRAIDLFTAAATKLGLHLAWAVSFCDQSHELCQKFGIVGNPNFRNLTVGTTQKTLQHSALPELEVTTACAISTPDSVELQPTTHAQSLDCVSDDSETHTNP